MSGAHEARKREERAKKERKSLLQRKERSRFSWPDSSDDVDGEGSSGTHGPDRDDAQQGHVDRAWLPYVLTGPE